jgi:hypothetical protein
MGVVRVAAAARGANTYVVTYSTREARALAGILVAIADEVDAGDA